MSRRAVAQPRKSSLQSGLTGGYPRTHAGPVEFGRVIHPKIHSRARIKKWDAGFNPADFTILSPSQAAAPEAADSESPGYRKISEIKNRIRSSIYQTATGFNLSTGLKLRGKARPGKFSQRGNASITMAVDGGMRPDFINPDIKPPARISDISEYVISAEEIDTPISGKIKPLLNASALLADAAVDTEAAAANVETAPKDSPKSVSAEKTEAPLPVKSFEEKSPQTIWPLKRALKLIRPPEVKADENEVQNKTEQIDPIVAIKEDEFVLESEKINTAAGSDDNIQIQEIESRSNIEFDLPDNEAPQTDTGLDSDVAAAEIISEPVEPSPVATDLAEPISGEEKTDEVQPQIRLELKNAAEGPRPEMKRPDLSRALRSDSRPWSMDVEIALRDLMGDIADPTKISFEQMAAAWKRGYDTYFSMSLEHMRFPYIWVDIHTVSEPEKDCEKRLVSFVGANLRGQLRLLVLVEENTDNPEFWRDILRDLEKRDLANPRLFIGDSRLPLWQSLGSVFPRSEIQYCQTALKEQILQQFPRDHSKEARKHLEKIYQAVSQRTALDLVEQFKFKYADKFPHAVSELIKHKDNLFTFFRFPRRHWYAIGQSGRIGGACPSRALLATVFKYNRFRALAVYLVFNYLLRTQRRWPRITFPRFLRRVQAGKTYTDGRRTRGRQPLGMIIARKMRKRTALTAWFFESVRSVLSIFYNRSSSGKKPVFKNPGHKSGPTQMNAVRKTISRPVIKPAIDEQPSRLVSGLERDLLEDMKLEKVAS